MWLKPVALAKVEGIITVPSTSRWPSQSPDLKPTGHLCDDLKMAVHS